MRDDCAVRCVTTQAARSSVVSTATGPNPGQESSSCPRLSRFISAFHNLSAGDLADEHGQLCAQIADLETRKRAIAGEVTRRGVSEAEGALFRCIVISEAMVCTLDRAGIGREMGEAWVARFLKWSKRSAHVGTTARDHLAPLEGGAFLFASEPSVGSIVRLTGKVVAGWGVMDAINFANETTR